ncbi:MAG: tetratricopeptide repeat protein [Pseudomonadota bacterium]
MPSQANQHSPAKRYRFGDCELDLDTRRFTRAGEPVTLQPRVFDLLVFLIEQRHRAVDKNAIQDAVWRPMIVSETALTRAIMKARRAVGDDAGQQAIIRTVHGHGYQFVAQLAESATGSAPVGTGKIEAASPGLLWRLRWPLLAAVVVLSVAVGGLLWRAPVDSVSARIAVLPVSNVTGDDELDWARFGLMGLANDLFADATEIETVSAADVVRFVENTSWGGDLDAPEAEARLAQLQKAYRASYVLVSELERNVGGLRLNYTLVSADGRRKESTMVSDRSAQLVRGMVRSVTMLLGDRRYVLAEGRDAIADDLFINEAYARAMGLTIEGRCNEAVPLFDVVLAENPAVLRARIEQATCRYRLGQWERAEQSYNTLLERPDVSDTAVIRAEVLGGLGTVYHRTGRLELAGETYREGLDLAQTAGDKLAAARLLISMAILAKDRRDFALARERLARATLVYRQLEWEVLPGQIPSTLANIAMNDGKYDEAEQHLDDALLSFRALGDRRNEAMMLNNYGFLRRLQGRFNEAEELHLQSLSIRREIGDRVGQGRILGMLSVIYEHGARYAEAKDAAAEAVAVARAANDRLFMATGLAQLAAAERGLGNPVAARNALEESRALFTGIEDFSRAAQVELRLARLDIDEGELAAADARIQAVLTAAQDAELPEPAIEAMEYAGDVAVLRGDAATAVRYYEDALAEIDRTGFNSEKTPIAISLAGLYLDRRDLTASEPLLGYLVEQEPSVDSLRLRARYAYATGDILRSVSLMETAESLAGESWSSNDAETLALYREAR